jgi:nucleoside-diphosphate-sugar epimerase
MTTDREVIAITGASGLIGAALTRAWVDRYHVVGFDIAPPREQIPGSEHIEMDLTSDESVRDALQQVRNRHGERIASTVHLAAYYDFSGDESPMYDEITVRGTSRLLRTLRDYDLDQFIFSSTMLVHEPAEPGERITEDSPVRPTWPYPESKVKAEEVIFNQRCDSSIVILRIAGVYDDDCHSPPISQQIKRIYEKQLIGRVFPGDTSRGQSFLHLDDLVDAFVRLIDRRRDLPEETVLLLGEPETLSYDQLQRMISRLIHGEEWETSEIPKALAKAGAWVQNAIPVGEEPFIKPGMIDLADHHYALDISRARELLHWEPRRSLRDTLPLIIESLKDDPERFYRENKLDSAPS